jgi:hypothetical protein
MDSSLIAAFCAAGVAGVTSIINIIVSVTNAQKNNNIQVIVETRIAYMQQLRNANATFSGLADPDVIHSLKKIDNGLFVYPRELGSSAGLLRTLLKPFYSFESRLIGLIDAIEHDSLILFEKGTDNALTEKIKNNLVVYMKLFAQYDWAYWQYIMKQVDGKCKNSNLDFDAIYKETEQNIAKCYKNNYKWM